MVTQQRDPVILSGITLNIPMNPDRSQVRTKALCSEGIDCKTDGTFADCRSPLLVVATNNSPFMTVQVAG